MRLNAMRLGASVHSVLWVALNYVFTSVSQHLKEYIKYHAELCDVMLIYDNSGAFPQLQYAMHKNNAGEIDMEKVTSYCLDLYCKRWSDTIF